MATAQAEHRADVYVLGRFAAWLARRLLEVGPGPVYAASCTCGWIGPPQVAEGDAFNDAIAHEWQHGD